MVTKFKTKMHIYDICGEEKMMLRNGTISKQEYGIIIILLYTYVYKHNVHS